MRGGDLVVDEVRVAVEDIELQNGDDPEIDFEGPFVIRLIQSGNIVDEALPAIGTTSIPAGKYEELELNLKKISAGDIPAEATNDPIVTQFLVGNTMVIQGSFWEAAGNDIDGDGNISQVLFRFLSDDDSQVEVEAPQVINLGEGFNVIFLTFQIDLFFDQEVLTALQNLDPNTFPGGTLVLSDESPFSEIRDVVDLIEGKIKESLALADEVEEPKVDEGESEEPPEDEPVPTEEPMPTEEPAPTEEPTL